MLKIIKLMIFTLSALMKEETEEKEKTGRLTIKFD